MRSSFLGIFLAFVSSLAMTQTQATPAPQTARQALIEMFFGTAPNHLEKHLPETTRNTLKKLGSADGMSAFDEFNMIAMQARMGGGKFETFETGPTLLSAEVPDGSKVELDVERDDLISDEDEIELSLHLTKENKEQTLPFIPRFTFVMKSDADVWRLNEITVNIKVPLADPAFLKSLEDKQRAQNEQMAMISVRSIIYAETSYSKAQGSFACSLAALGDANKTPDHHIYLFDRQLMEGKKGGYVFAISGCDASHYKLAAEPALPDSGQRAFCADESGTMRASSDGKATSCISNGEPVENSGMQVIGGRILTAPPVAASAESGRQPRVVPIHPASSDALPQIIVASPGGAGLVPQRVRVSGGVMQGLRVSSVAPVYPEMAKAERVQGAVVLAAIIGKDGSVQSLHVINTASPLLNQAAIDAVKQWKYRAYILDGNPVEVDTTIAVNFALK